MFIVKHKKHNDDVNKQSCDDPLKNIVGLKKCKKNEIKYYMEYINKLVCICILHTNKQNIRFWKGNYIRVYTNIP